MQSVRQSTFSFDGKSGTWHESRPHWRAGRLSVKLFPAQSDLFRMILTACTARKSFVRNVVRIWGIIRWRFCADGEALLYEFGMFGVEGGIKPDFRHFIILTADYSYGVKSLYSLIQVSDFTYISYIEYLHQHTCRSRSKASMRWTTVLRRNPSMF